MNEFELTLGGDGSVRAAVLDLVYDVRYGGPASLFTAAERALDALIEACAASEPCAERGDLGEMIERVRSKLNDEPIEIAVPLDDEPTDFVITGDDVIAGLFNAMYSDDLLPTLPSIVAQLDRGVTVAVPTFVQTGVPFFTRFADLMAFAVDCADKVIATVWKMTRRRSA